MLNKISYGTVVKQGVFGVNNNFRNKIIVCYSRGYLEIFFCMQKHDTSEQMICYVASDMSSHSCSCPVSINEGRPHFDMYKTDLFFFLPKQSQNCRSIL